MFHGNQVGNREKQWISKQGTLVSPETPYNNLIPPYRNSKHPSDRIFNGNQARNNENPWISKLGTQSRDTL